MGPFILIALGLLSLWVSYEFGSQFYPFGEDYAEQRRNGIISIFLLVIGLFLLGVGLMSAGVFK